MKNEEIKEECEKMKNMNNVNLKWIRRRAHTPNGTKYIVWTCVQAGIIKIVKYENYGKYILSGRKYEMPFKKFTMAKQVANLIYNG